MCKKRSEGRNKERLIQKTSCFERKNMNKKELKNTEWSILICTIILIAIGLFALYSASKSADLEELKKQVIWIAVRNTITYSIIFS